MKTITTQVAGISFYPKAASLLPIAGKEVVIKHEPVVTEKGKEYPLAVSLYYDGVMIGHLAEKSYEQKAFHEGKIKSCKIKSYSYAKEDEHGVKTFNQEDEGVLGSITLEIEIDDAGEEEQGTGAPSDRYYVRDGKNYERITRFLGRTKHLYEKEESIKRLEDWQKRNEDGLGFTSRLGTLVHRLLEEQVKAKVGIAQKILDQLGLDLVDTEQTVYDDLLGLAGTYDALCNDKDGNLYIIDWKTSKNAQKSHKLQSGFYGKNVGAKKAYVVCLGAGNKQGFSICTVDVEKEYEELKKIKSLSNPS
jgi:hypothetical protein